MLVWYFETPVSLTNKQFLLVKLDWFLPLSKRDGVRLS